MNLKNRTLAREAEISKEMADLAKEKEVMMAADTEEAYARLANIRSMELRLEAEQQQLQQQGVPALTAEHLANVIELWTNIPASHYIVETGFKMLGIALISAACTVTVGFLGARVAAGVSRGLRRDVFTACLLYTSGSLQRTGSDDQASSARPGHCQVPG